MEIAFGLDNDQDAERTFRTNFPEADFVREDIRDVATWELDQFVERCSDHPLWFSACAPCQPFSQQRRGIVPSGDERSGVLGHLMRFVERHRPEFVFLENVPGLRKRSLGLQVFEPLTEGLGRLGYFMEKWSSAVPRLRRSTTKSPAGALGKYSIPRLISRNNPRPGSKVPEIRDSTRLHLRTPLYLCG